MLCIFSDEFKVSPMIVIYIIHHFVKKKKTVQNRHEMFIFMKEFVETLL